MVQYFRTICLEERSHLLQQIQIKCKRCKIKLEASKEKDILNFFDLYIIFQQYHNKKKGFFTLVACIKN